MAWQDNTELATLRARLEARAAELREEVAAGRYGDCAACQARFERG